MTTILVVDDEPVIQDVVRLALTDARHVVVAARSGEAALQTAGRERPDLVIIDNKLPGIDGLETLRRLRVSDPGLSAIVLTGYASLPNAVEALTHGVLDYVSKPFLPRELPAAVERALASRAGKHRLTVKPEAPSASSPVSDPFHEARGGLPGFDDIVGDCPAMREVFRLIPRVAATDEPVLIVGETGTGKELVARAIHRHSPRAKGLFVEVNCAAIPATLVESELFGHERGAFTDAREARAGKFELAQRGTLFLDEIGDMPVEAQAKILRAVERREVARLGGSRNVAVDTRVVTATNADLDLLVARGAFRRDLYYRLDAFTVRLPPLRERGSDVGLLVDYLLDRVRRNSGDTDKRLAPAAREALLSGDWPGNVRELEHHIRQAVAAAEGTTVEIDDLPHRLAVSEVSEDRTALPDAFNLVAESARVAATFERRQIRAALTMHGGNQKAAARALGIDRRTLHTKMRQFRLISD